MVHSHNGVLPSHQIQCHHEVCRQTDKTRKKIIWSEVIQTQKDKCGMYSFKVTISCEGKDNHDTVYRPREAKHQGKIKGEHKILLVKRNRFPQGD